MHLLPKVFVTEGDVVEFDPTKILQSLVSETRMKEEDAKHITELTVRRIISSGMKFLSGPHIREIVCSILSEQHFEQERKLYTRIGMPLMDYEEILEKGIKTKTSESINPETVHHWAADQIAQEYALLRILDDEEMKAHLNGDIYIYKLKYFDSRPLSQYWDPRIVLKYGLPPVSGTIGCGKSGPASNLRVAVNHLAKWLGMVQAEFCGNQSFDFITIFLAPYVRGLTTVEIKQSIQSFVYEINQLSGIISQETPITSLLCTPTVLDSFLELPAIGPYGKVQGVYGDYKEECLKLFDAIAEIFKDGDYNKIAFNYPLHLVYLTKEWLKEHDSSYVKVAEEISSNQAPFVVNLSASWLDEKIKSQISELGFINRGVLQGICLNLPRYALQNAQENRFFDHLRATMKSCSKILVKKADIIEKRLKAKRLPLSGGIIDGNSIFDLTQQQLTFSFVGLNEAIKILANSELHENKDAFLLGKKTVQLMKEYCGTLSDSEEVIFDLAENASTNVVSRFAQLDLKHYKNLPIMLKNQNSGRYTNSFHFSSENKIITTEKAKMLGEFHALIQNGVFEIVSLKTLENENLMVRTFADYVCHQTELGALKFTP